VKSRPSYSCDTCGHHIHPTAGTIFHKSATSLHLWCYAIYLMTIIRFGKRRSSLSANSASRRRRHGASSNLIRNQLMTDDDDKPLDGVVGLTKPLSKAVSSPV
jgi:hypothetical protein